MNTPLDIIAKMDTTGFDPFIHELFVKAMGLHHAMLAMSPAGQIEVVTNPLVTEAEIVLVFFPKPKGVELAFVKGSSKTATMHEIPISRIAAFTGPDRWTYAAWRIALGDEDFDDAYRDGLKSDDPEAYERLPKWLTPAGYEERLGLKGFFGARTEILYVNRFERAFAT